MSSGISSPKEAEHRQQQHLDFDSDTETLPASDASPPRCKTIEPGIEFEVLPSLEQPRSGSPGMSPDAVSPMVPSTRNARSATTSSTDISDNKRNTPSTATATAPPKRKAAAASLAIDTQHQHHQSLQQQQQQQQQQSLQQTNSRKRKRTCVIHDEIEVRSARSRESSASTTVSSVSTEQRSSDSMPPPSSISPPITSPPFSSKPITDARINRRNQAGETPLHRACAAGKIDEVRDLLDRGANVNAQCNAGWTPLHKACLKGRVEIVRLLCQRGANPDIASNDEHDTPLHDACGNGHEDVVDILLSHGANPRIHNSEGSFPDEMVSDNELLRQRVLDAKNSFKETKKENDEHEDSEPQIPPAHKRPPRRASIAAEPPVGRSTRRSAPHHRDDLLALDIHYRDPRNRGHLHLSASQGDATLVEHLLIMGADYKAKDKEGNTPLHLAARGGHSDTVLKLLQYGSEAANFRNKAGETPLHEVAGRGHLFTMKLLLSYLADPTIQDSEGRTPLDVALESPTSAEGEVDMLEQRFRELGITLPEPQTAQAENRTDEMEDIETNVKVEETDDIPLVRQNETVPEASPRNSPSPQPSPVSQGQISLQNETIVDTVSRHSTVPLPDQEEPTAPEGVPEPMVAEERVNPRANLGEQIDGDDPGAEISAEPMIADRSHNSPEPQPPQSPQPIRSPSSPLLASTEVSTKAEMPKINRPASPRETQPPCPWIHMSSFDSLTELVQKELNGFVPFYTITYDGQTFVTHIQVCTLLGLRTDEFFEKYPQISKRALNNAEKAKWESIFTFPTLYPLSPPIRTFAQFIREELDADNMLDHHDLFRLLTAAKKAQFMKMSVYLVPLDDILQLFEKDFPGVLDAVQRKQAIRLDTSNISGDAAEVTPPDDDEADRFMNCWRRVCSLNARYIG